MSRVMFLASCEDIILSEASGDQPVYYSVISILERLTTFGFFGGWPNYVTTRFRLARVQRMVYARGNQPRSSLLPETHSCKRFFVRYPPPSPSPTFIQARRTQFFLGRIHILNLRHL